MSELPKGWSTAKVRDLTTKVGSGSTPRGGKSDYKISGIPLIRSMNVHFDGFKPKGLAFIDDKQAKMLQNVVVQEGDVLLNITGASIGRVTTAPVRMNGARVNQHVSIIRPTDALSSKFLSWFLASPGQQELINRIQVGATRQALTKTMLLDFDIPLPPLPEQRRIVARIEELFSRLDAGVAALRHAKTQLHRYRQSVLAAAVTGQLTQAWREQHPDTEPAERLLERILKQRREQWAGRGKYKEPLGFSGENPFDTPPSWALANFEQVSRRVTVGHVGSMKDEYTESGVPFLRGQNVRANRFDPNGLKFISREFHLSLSKSLIRGGDIAVTRSGDVGIACVIPEELGEANCSDLVLVQGPILIDPYFAAYYMNSLGRRLVQEGKVGVAITHFNTQAVAAMPLPLPPLAEQRQIVAEVEARTSAIDHLEAEIDAQAIRSNRLRQSILNSAFSGTLVESDPNDEPVAALLARIAAAPKLPAKVKEKLRNKSTSASPVTQKMKLTIPTISPELVAGAWSKIGKGADAKSLFTATGAQPVQVVEFYEALRNSPEVLAAFRNASPQSKAPKLPQKQRSPQKRPEAGKFRLVDLWLENFKNLKNYDVQFGPASGFDVVLGWNGTGKSNLFEALVLILRELHYWKEKNRWPDQPMGAYSLTYEINQQRVSIVWKPSEMKRPFLGSVPVNASKNNSESSQAIKRQDLPLPKFVFGYYSGPTNRLSEHFFPMKRDHYEALRDAKSDDSETIADLLARRRFFCAETSHAKYVLLAFAYKEDARISQFLEERLRIVGFESALFVIRKPRWARNADPKDFWGAKGVMRKVMEKLRQYSIAPMVLRQSIQDGYQTGEEEHYYFFLPDLTSLHAFAAEYADAPSFFVALESTDFSELVHDVRIQVSIKDSADGNSPVTFRELSEGEQQLLMVLGLMRFTKSHQSLILLDEPDTHLNPHWSVDFLKDLASVMSDSDKAAPEQQTSQLLMATHDPLVIASLVKEQIHLLKRDPDTLHCFWKQASQDPRGLGYTGILISEMFGFRSDLDEETLDLLDRQVQLAGQKAPLSKSEKNELAELNRSLEPLGFKTANSDPYYRAFIQGLVRNKQAFALLKKPVQSKEDREAIDKATDQILATLAKKHHLGQ